MAIIIIITTTIYSETRWRERVFAQSFGPQLRPRARVSKKPIEGNWVVSAVAVSVAAAPVVANVNEHYRRSEWGLKGGWWRFKERRGVTRWRRRSRASITDDGERG